MASFCWDCHAEMFYNSATGEGIPPARNDMAGVCKEGEMFLGLCEGCGVHNFDHEGRRVPERPMTEGDWAERYEDPRVPNV